MKMLNNNKGVVLITTYIFLMVLITLTAGFAMSAVSELNNARRYRDSTAAFWLAEAGINQFIKDTTMLDSLSGETDIYLGSNYVHLVKDDTNPSQRVVTGTGFINGISRQVQITFPALASSLFSQNLSVGGNLHTAGWSWRPSSLYVNGKTRLGGIYDCDTINLIPYFDDKLENRPDSETKLTYPDADDNGTADQYADFVQFYTDLVATYPEDDYVYIEPSIPGGTIDDIVNIYPNKEYSGKTLAGKKIVFINGGAPGKGKTRIYFDATNWQDDQNLTVISTGTIEYYEPLQGVADNSKLNFIAWGGDATEPAYKQGSMIVATHNGTIYSHEEAQFTEILSTSITDGNVIANTGMEFVNWLKTTKYFNYVDALAGGSTPPGFEGLGSGSGYQTTPNSWKEI